MEKTIQHKMVYMFLKDRKKEGEAKQFSVNGKDGIIKIEFVDHERAKAFYDDANFIEKILIRPFNIYFNLTLSEAEMKKYYLEGITEENQRNLFLECRKLGFCKLYTNYSSGPRGKLKPNGVLSFIRKDNIPEADFKVLSDNLKALGIKINNYVHEKGLKCSINLLNFHKADFALDEAVIQEQSEAEARKLIKEMGVAAETSLTVVVKKKEANERSPAKVAITAFIEYADVEQTMNEFEKMRDYLVNNGEAKAVLFFHNEENNSYLSLFTPGLGKPAELTEKQFENKLLQDFRTINKNVIQVNIFHVQYNDTYIGRVYLRTEQDGKDFIVDYSSKRASIFKNYKEQGIITFNINVDTKTLRKIKQAERKAKETEDKIKKQSEANRRETRRPPNAFPIQSLQGMQGMPNIPMGIGPNIVLPSIQNNLPPGIGGIGGLGPIGMGQMPMPMGAFNGPLGMKPQMMGQGGPGGFPPQNSADNIRQRIKHIIKDKANFLNANQDSTKRLLSEPLKFLIEEAGIPNSQSGSFLSN
jgi:hypothetical protein